MKWCGQKPKLTPEQVAEVRRLSALKRSARDLPSWAELGRRWGVATETVRNATKLYTFKRYRLPGEDSPCT